MASGGAMLPSAAAAPPDLKVSLLSPEPAPGQRHALSHASARSLSLISHLRAAWQGLKLCMMHAAL